MQITINTRAFIRAMRQICRIAPTKPAFPALAGVRIEANADESEVILSATDVELALSHTCAATVRAAGLVVLPAKRLLDAVSDIKDEEITLTLSKASVLVNSGNFKSRVMTLDAHDFPTLPQWPGGAALFSRVALLDMITKVHGAISKEDQRHFLNGALLSCTDTSFGLIATNGKRLAVTTSLRALAGDSFDAVLPLKFLDAVASLDTTDDEIAFVVSDNHLFVSSDSIVLSSRRISGKFPAYTQFIPSHTQSCVFDRTAAHAALRRVSFAADAMTSAVRCTIEDGHVTFTAHSASVAEASEHVVATIAGDACKLTIDYRLLLEFLAVSHASQIEVRYADAQSAILCLDGETHINVIGVMR